MRQSGTRVDLLKKLLFIGILTVALWFIASYFSLKFPPQISTPYSKEILDKDGNLLNCFLSQDQKWRLQTTKDQIPKKLIDIIIWKEDKHFYAHPGINPIAVCKSALQNLTKGKRLSGASTITMQAVKLNEPGKRTWLNKIKEAFKALYWEMAFSKSEILTFYLSHLPFGGNVEGFRAASLIYFGKNPKQLTLSQWVTLSIIPNQPTKLNPINNPELLKKRRNQFLKKMWEAGEISESEFIEASLEPIFATKHPLPKRIPHLARKLLQNPDYQIQTTIDSKIQNNVEQILEANTISLQRLGIKNAAVLIAEIKTGEIVSWIGNSDFNDKTNAGEVDGVEALRSPGSTLKPFIYEMAFRKGLITPKTVLYDVPTEFSSYVPENFDQEFRGKVFADQSLIQSLNIPAIQLLKSISIDSLLKVLEKNGMKKLMQNSKYPGLSLAVGGCNTNLYELVQAYCTLADHGFYKPLFTTKQKNRPKRNQVLETASTDMVRQILSLKNRNEALFSINYHKEEFESITWKTGTSFGRKDAWCIGFGKKYVLGVWLGNFSGEGNPALSGLEIAAPIFQKIIANIEKNEPPRNPTKLQTWKKRLVCKESGNLPGPQCNNTIEDLYLPLISSQKTCSHVKEIWVNQSETVSYCGQCKPGNGCKKIWLENPEPSFRSFLISKGIIQKTPLHNPNCPFAETNFKLSIEKPGNGKTYFLEGKQTLGIEVKINAESDGFPVSIFRGSKKEGVSKNGEGLLIQCEAGTHKISAIDSRGRTCQSVFSVKEF